MVIQVDLSGDCAARIRLMETLLKQYADCDILHMVALVNQSYHFIVNK